MEITCVQREEADVMALGGRLDGLNPAILKKKLAEQLEELGYPVYSMQVTGCAAGDVGNYELEQQVVEKFGEDVLPDSEHSQLFILVKRDKAQEVLEFVREHGKEGEEYETYGAGSFKASFGSYDIDPSVKGMNNWDDAYRYLGLNRDW